MPRKNEELVPCPAGCGYSVPANKAGQPHNILVDGHWITCPGS